MRRNYLQRKIQIIRPKHNPMTEKEHKEQVKEGERFQFGKNWNSFLSTLTDERINVAETSLKRMIGTDDFGGRSFLDIGCGSGLFSLAAKNLNAKVHSLDFDLDSVNCAKYLKEKFHKDSDDWTVEEASVLDADHMGSVGQYDIVYSWGVLHHTGNMHLALENAALPVKDGGILFIAIYNDQGGKSKVWLRIKEIYNANFLGKAIMSLFFFGYFGFRSFLSDVMSFKNPIKSYGEYKRRRGMSRVHDWRDWIGGLPFEVGTPELIFDFYKERGFQLERMKTTNTLGCNEFVFIKRQ